MSRDTGFQKIKQYFDAKDKELHKKGKLPLGSTEKGFWGVSHLDDFYEWCKSTALDKKTSFVDLGSGDGRCVFVAALFTQAIGIEYDSKLHHEALLAAQELGSSAQFLQRDYTDIDLSVYDIWFSYADHNFNWLEQKQTEVTDLYLYHDTFHPHFLEKQKTLWIGQIPVFHYRRNSENLTQE